MLARTFTATTIGLNPIKIEVEVDATIGKPGLVFIGLPSQAVMEAKERITSALVNCGIRIKAKKTVVNLAPADLKKSSSAFDFAIAVAILKMYGLVHASTDTCLFLGELSLDGKLKPITGALALVLKAQQIGFDTIILPRANQHEVSSIKSVTIHPIDHLQDYLNFCQKNVPLSVIDSIPIPKTDKETNTVDIGNIRGHNQAKRALQIAAAGGHNLLFVGPPGVGKSMLAQSLAGLLPPLTEKESLELTAIYSLKGLAHQGLITERPFRQAHATISKAALIGGGSNLLPGEISLAHRGVLFLDEMAEFNRDILDSLRQPLEQGFIHVSRASGTVLYPARFSLIGATNPCPCGFSYSLKKVCRCSPSRKQSYLSKISGPILDRIDLQVFISEVDLNSFAKPDPENVMTTQTIKRSIVQAREHQQKRYASSSYSTNAEADNHAIKKTIQLSPVAQKILLKASQKINLSPRSYFKMIKVARTIADLGNMTTIESEHVAEALQFRLNQMV